MNWIGTSLILCTFGFLKEFRPHEPFINNYLIGSSKNFTEEELIHEVYPIATYSNFATLVVVFLLTDFLRYKPIIILCGLSGVITFTILALGTSIAAIQAVEFFYGLYLSTEVAYYTYIYAKVDKEHYQVVSGYTRSALLLGRFITGVVGQLLITFKLFNYLQLNYLTIFGQVLAVICSLFLPSVGLSTYFNRTDDNNTDSDNYINCDSHQCTTPPTKLSVKRKCTVNNIQRAYYLLWQDCVKAYSNVDVLKWSLWWAAASCGYLQVLSYTQPIWDTCVEKNATIYNGAVEAFYTAIGALAVFIVGKLPLNWAVLGESFLSVFSFIEAVLLYFISTSFNIWFQYVIYIAFGVIYHTIVTICTSEVAKRISEDSFGLIFGINIFLALSIQSILTFIVTSKNVFKLDIRIQFAVYSGYFALLGVIFMIIAIFTIMKLCKGGKKLTWLSTKNDLDHNRYNYSIDQQRN